MRYEEPGGCLPTYRSKKCRVTLNNDGKGWIIFDVSKYSLYTIAIINDCCCPMIGWIEVSPDGRNFKMDDAGKVEILPNSMEPFVAGIFLQYTALVIEGPPGISVTIFLQGIVSCV